MHRIDGSGATVDNKFTEGDPVGGIQATVVTDSWLNAVQEELLAVLTAAGIAPLKSSQNQVLAALRKLAQNSDGSYTVDTGTANTYLAAYAPAVTALVDGAVLKFKAKTGNTGASTFSPNGVAAKPIVGGDHAALQGGEIVANGEVWLQYNSSIGGGSWVVVGSSGGALQVAAPTQVRHAVNVSDFPCLFSANGYLKLPVSVGGFKRVLILQWVSQSAVGVSGKVDNFPIQFPTAVLIEWATVSVPGGPLSQYAAVVSPPSLTTIQTVVNTGNAAVAAFALGY
ncbi:gp53-like domain-containing protein [Pseudomonas sp. NMI795_08]|uniref:gp53-like domain-containing protein n=1 Tax=Pseudomonas sp. NMI795_08 TaxID=2903144 RepID=UPI001E4530A8|nr:hypothetical protein [Pseudomonas sp. NMI795_08]MCE1117463.1 hypothetical protein [Pseudomonas sp. NMI795_08]